MRQGVFAILIAVLAAAFRVGGNARERSRGFVSGGQIDGFSPNRRPNHPVANGGQLVEFLNFFGVVDVAKRFPAASVGVNAVEHLVVVEPKPILVVDSLMNFLSKRLSQRRFQFGTVKRLRQSGSQLSVAGLIQMGAVDGKPLRRPSEPFGGKREKIRKR